jgi:L-cysteine:1D-myo-inositol 2-amino-2-deoxy-alpha-D-glucopyranoside ligase
VLDEVRDALDDDLDTPRALAAIDVAAAAGQDVSGAASLLGVELATSDEEPVKRP